MRHAEDRKRQAYFNTMRSRNIGAMLTTPAPRSPKQYPAFVTWISVVALLVLFVFMTALLVSRQATIVRVLSSGRSVQAVVTGKVDPCYKGDDDLSVRFTDARGKVYAVNESSPVFGCVDNYQAGDVIQIRYLPGDPKTLMTQAEINAVPGSTIAYALMDVILIGGGAVVRGLLLVRAWSVLLRTVTSR